MEKAKVTICVVNYKTLELTKLCLRSIRKYTRYPYKVVVVDNNSGDESTEYLRGLDWIELIERTDPTTDKSGGYAHGAALDMALARCDTEYFMSMHSDTFVHKEGWLAELMQYFEDEPEVVCVGGGKVELCGAFRRFIKRVTDYKTMIRKGLRIPDPKGKFRYYNRTVCSVYKTGVLKEQGFTFLMGREDGYTVGKKLYFELVDRGFKTVEIPDKKMLKNVWHLAHATQVINNEEFDTRAKTKRKIRRLINEMLNSEEIQTTLNDESLDKGVVARGF